MTEHDLSTLLRDDLAGEPPLRHDGTQAIRTARRQSARRRLLAGSGALALVAVATLSLGGGSVFVDDAPPASVAKEPAPALTDVMESAAEAGFAPYVGALGAPGWSISDGLGETAAADDPAAQYFRLSYHPASRSLRVNLSVGGFAPADFQKYSFADTCRQQLAEKLAESCDATVLDDGSLLITTVALRSGIETPAQRMLTRKDAASMPPESIAWVRVVGLSTLDGMSVDAAEYQPAGPGLAPPDWQVPLPALREMALDPALRSAEVAHEPFPTITDE